MTDTGQKRSKLYWIQKVSAVSLTLFIAAWISLLIQDANTECQITGIRLTTTKPTGLTEDPKSSPPNVVGEKQHFTLSGFQDRFSMCFAIQGREGLNMLRPLQTRLQRRLEWSVFARSSQDLWLPRTTASGPTLSWELSEPGTYLIVCSLPPINLGNGQQSTIQLRKILRGIYSQRCSALLLDVESKPRPGPPNTNLGLSNRVFDLTTRQEGENRPEGIKPSELVSTNRLTQHDEHLKSVQVPLRNANRIESVLTRVKENMEGGLPELSLFWIEDQLKGLTYDELILLTKAYDMPLILVPQERFHEKFGGVVAIDPSDNSRITLQDGEIHRRFGRYILPLGYFNDRVVDELRKKVEPIDWMKADQKFFLLGLATLLPLRAALDQADSLEEVRSVSATFVIIKREGRLLLDLDRISVKKN